MPQYLSPGVYVEETPSGSAPIVGVGTSTAGFIGEASDELTMPAQPGEPHYHVRIFLDEAGDLILESDVAQAAESVLIAAIAAPGFIVELDDDGMPICNDAPNLALVGTDAQECMSSVGDYTFSLVCNAVDENLPWLVCWTDESGNPEVESLQSNGEISVYITNDGPVLKDASTSGATLTSLASITVTPPAQRIRLDVDGKPICDAGYNLEGDHFLDMDWPAEVMDGGPLKDGVGVTLSCTDTQGVWSWVAESDSGALKTEHPAPLPIPYPLAPMGQARLVTGWTAFKNLFGDIQDSNRVLAHAVYGFFNNGGSRCWVTRFPATLTAANVQTALAGFESIDEIAIVAAPIDQPEVAGVQKAIQTAVVDHCQKMKDRFAILDGTRSPSSVTPGSIANGLGANDHAALYYPWIRVYDPATDADVFTPPSGHIAGVYARVDAQRGVHKAPANEVIRGALGVEKILKKSDQDGLNPKGVNVIRPFNGAVTIWGARTLGGDQNGEWKYINVRRLFLYLRESIEEGVRWVVFEPNTPELWARITRNATAFLLTVWGAGALFGGAPEEAFYVKCDEETNPPEVRDLGQVVTEIGVAAARPAEFVIFRVSQWAGAGD